MTRRDGGARTGGGKRAGDGGAGPRKAAGKGAGRGKGRGAPGGLAAAPPPAKPPRGRAPQAPSGPTRGAQGLDLLYGVHAVRAALENPGRRIRQVWASPNAARRLALGADRAALLEIVPPAALDARLPEGAVHQGLAVLAEPLDALDVSDLAAMGRIAVLDQVTDPHNLGAILRSAAAFGIEAVVVTERNAPAATGLVAKIASGGLEAVPLVRATNLARALDALKGQGFFCVGLAGETEVTLADALAGAPRVALVLGAEGEGLRRLTRERCDLLARIPMPGRMESLNVSNAAAIAFYLASRAVAD